MGATCAAYGGEVSESVATAGLHGKYHGLRRTSDNSEVEGWYFVIREGDEAGKVALLAYADACEDYAPELAADLRRHVYEERLMDGLYEAGWER
jgi:hypothetical protein